MNASAASQAVKGPGATNLLNERPIKAHLQARSMNNNSARQSLTSRCPGLRSHLQATVHSSICRHIAGTASVTKDNSAMSLTSADDEDQYSNGMHAAAMMAPSLSAEPSNVADKQPALVVFSGGTAFNSVAGHVRQLTTRVTHVLPISDDGGSTAEIVRVLGGPAVGDIRSRCLRLADDVDQEAEAVRQLLAHRLAFHDSAEAKAEWYEIIEGEHPLWQGVSDPYKHTIRAFLVHFHVNILRHSTERFNFRGGSVGNFFFAGARIFFRSLEAAIFLFSRVARIPEGSLVLPAICTEERITLGAELTDGSLICGQNEISHPSCQASPMAVDKLCVETLMAPIRRVFYMSSEGDHQEHEVSPLPNPRIITELQKADAVVYGMGSLYTSICPSLILKGVGECVAEQDIPKIFVLNGSIDRETSVCQAHLGPMRASDMVLAITDALNRKHSKKSGLVNHKPSSYVTAVLVPEGSPVEVDESVLMTMGVQKVRVVPATRTADGAALYDPDSLVAAISQLVNESKSG